MKLHPSSAMVAILAASASAGPTDLYCDMIRAEPKPEGSHCGGIMSPSNLDYLIDTPDVSTRRECARACYDNQLCKSFTWDPTAPTCRLYDANGKTMQISQSIDGNTQFWNHACHVCRVRRFALKVAPASEPYNDKYVVLTQPDANIPMRLNGFGADASEFTPFNIREDGTLVPADDSSMTSWQGFYSDGGNPAKNLAASNIKFMTDAYAAQDEKNVPVKCSIDRSYRFTCYATGGARFFGCDNPEDLTKETSGVMLARVGSTDVDLHSQNCYPIKMRAQTLFDQFVDL